MALPAPTPAKPAEPTVLHDRASWDVDNLLGRYHLWKIHSRFPIPGSVLLNDYRRRGRGVTYAAVDKEVTAMQEEDKKTQAIKR